jgi:hypothetical protein
MWVFSNTFFSDSIYKVFLFSFQFDLLKTESGQRQPRRIATDALHEADDQREEVEEEELKRIASGQD